VRTIKTGLLTAIMSVVLAAPVSARADLTELLDMSEQFDKIEKQDFNAALDRVGSCTSTRDFACAEDQLAKAARVANGSRDAKALAGARWQLQAEREALATELRLAAEERERQRVAALREEEMRRAEEAREEKANSFQWGKAMAMATGAAIGGMGKLSAEAQGKIIDGIARDSVGGQQGIGNFSQASNQLRSEPSTRQAVRQAKQVANQQTPYLAKLGNAGNRKAGIGGQGEKQPTTPAPLEVYDRNGLVGGEPAVVMRSAEVWHDDMRTLERSGRSVWFPGHEQNIPGTVLHDRAGSRSAAEGVWTDQGGKVVSYSGCGSCGVGTTITIVVEFKHIIDTHSYIRDK